ncbi:OLC1v1030447C1 [Oldenlandia corymbosa var. corymbosa]|uniref:OLC1v1030447C1 n=1 Tax=Oldenlandia corymbosa var. corymbosa TaxID=529605 RepID=A0AAV1CG38_OLDCO|nr:OLC1v1030447C1 [Oldenlandia corymbosa var. corymbosa]
MPLEQMTIERISMGIRLYGLLVECHSKTTAPNMASMIGELLLVRTSELDARKATYLRERVAVKPYDPLPFGFYLDLWSGISIWIKCSYDRLHKYCQRCGLIGHFLDNCSIDRNDELEQFLDASFGHYIVEKNFHFGQDDHNCLFPPCMRMTDGELNKKNTRLSSDYISNHFYVFQGMQEEDIMDGFTYSTLAESSDLSPVLPPIDRELLRNRRRYVMFQVEHKFFLLLTICRLTPRRNRLINCQTFSVVLAGVMENWSTGQVIASPHRGAQLAVYSPISSVTEMLEKGPTFQKQECGKTPNGTSGQILGQYLSSRLRWASPIHHRRSPGPTHQFLSAEETWISKGFKKVDLESDRWLKLKHMASQRNRREEATLAASLRQCDCSVGNSLKRSKADPSSNFLTGRFGREVDQLIDCLGQAVAEHARQLANHPNAYLVSNFVTVNSSDNSFDGLAESKVSHIILDRWVEGTCFGNLVVVDANHSTGGLALFWVEKSEIERLDWAFASQTWLSRFPRSLVTNLPIPVSNHRLFVLETLKLPAWSRKKSLKFESFWSRSLVAQDIIDKVWHHQDLNGHDVTPGVLLTKLEATLKHLSDWSRHSFGTLNGRIQKCSDRLQQLQQHDGLLHHSDEIAAISKELDHLLNY